MEDYAVLFVDDEPLLLDSMVRSFSNDFKIKTAESGKEALKIIEEDNSIAVIVSDMDMPFMDGITFLAKVMEKNPDIVRILLTGKASLETAIDAVNKGHLYRFLTKPCKEADLIVDITSALNIYRNKIKQKIMIRQNEQLALYDILTGLPNRAYLIENLDRAMGLAKREKTILAVLFLDIDGFKNINDSHGHDIGDLLLIEIANRLKSSVRKTDIVSRFGGDEFVIILQNIKLVSNIDFIANLIIDIISDNIIIKEILCKVGISIGISIYPDDSENIEELLKKADSRMYKSKRAGGNRFNYSKD